MTIQVRTPFRDSNSGMIVNDFPSVAKRYLKTWFTVDFVSIFPFEMLTWGQETDNSDESSGNLAILRLLRLARLLKLLRILRASRKLQRFRVNTRLKYSVIQLVTVTWDLCALNVVVVYHISCLFDPLDCLWLQTCGGTDNIG